MRLALDAQAQTQARRYARSWSAEHAVAAPLVDDIELVVAELVSNAIRHGTAPYEVELYDNNGVIRGEVCDGPPVAPKANPSPDERGGYGLGIVDACTSRWGTDVVPTGKHVWFEVKPQTD